MSTRADRRGSGSVASGRLPRILAYGLASLTLFSSACMVGPKYQRPAAPVPPAYKEAPPPALQETPGWKPAQPNDAANRGKWWEVYNDPELNALEEQVSISNQNVLAAEAQFRAARAVVRIARANLFPTVTASPSIVNSRSSVTATTGTTYDLPAAVSYEVDLWGSIRRSVTAGAATAQASAAQLTNARLLFQADLALDYFELRGNDGAQELLGRTVKSYEEYLQLTRDRFKAGVASGGDVAQAQTQLHTARAELIDLGVARAQFEHAIAILIGKPPAALSIPSAPIKSPPPPIPAGVPSDLLERRPDIAAAERQMAAANEQIGIAKVAYYPALNLNLLGGFESGAFTQWLTWPSRIWSVGPQLAQTVFDVGRRRAQMAQVQALYDASVANYRQTVLTGFQQVEDNLAALRILAEEARAEDEAVRAAQDSLTIATYQYKAGTTSYLQVITTQSIALQDEITAVNILTRRMVSSVLLIEALGGGWDASTLPTTKSLVVGK